MKLSIKLMSAIMAVLLAISNVSVALGEDFEILDFFTGETEAAEEKEYIVYFNDSVVSLYAEDGKDYALMNEEELSASIDEGIVEFYEENTWVYLYEEEVFDPKQATYKWDVNMLKADYAFDRGYSGSGVRVAVIDSGCKETGDLYDNILEGYNLVDKTTDTSDAVGHGTMVSSQIAAEYNSVGFRGVAPFAKIIPLKIFDQEKKAKVSLLADAIKMAVDDFDCDIINMSLGGSNDSETLKAAVKYAASKNVLMVAASGNNGTSSYSYPAAYPEVIGVGAVDSAKKVCDYSQYNDGVDVCAPGGSEDKGLIYSLSPSGNDKYLKSKGTSFAAPLITGIAAIFRGLDSDFTHEEFKEIIIEASVDLGDEGYDVYYGYGLADIEKYLKYYFAPMGDSDVDGKVTANDAALIVKYIIGSVKDLGKEKAADVNKDGEINLIDAIMVARSADGWEGYELSYE